jgi:hypothetical protein
MFETKACVFCGRQPTTVEDIWPKWIGRYLGRRPARTIIRETSGITRMFHGFSNVQRAKVVCETCNGGWMKGLEDQANPLLKRMFDESFAITLLVGDTQLAVARWIVKTAMMLQFAYTQETTPAIPEADFKEFANDRTIPGNCVIFLARHRVQQIPNGSQSIAWDVSSNPRRPGVRFHGQLYGVTFFIKNLVMQIVGYRFDVATNAQLNLRFPLRFAPYVQRLWPMERRIEWPPSGPSLDDRQLVAFAAALAEIVPPGPEPGRLDTAP